jgi:hypothetical protein
MHVPEVLWFWAVSTKQYLVMHALSFVWRAKSQLKDILELFTKAVSGHHSPLVVFSFRLLCKKSNHTGIEEMMKK